MMFGIGTQEIIFIILIVLLFFGGKKIPELMKGIGKGVRSFKEGMNGIEKELDVKENNSSTKNE
ncbi:MULTISPECIES: Sec-independent protein translocase subunit TatA/TatB [Bacteroidales]|jgi:sec-independent protein translocase protein TatA